MRPAISAPPCAPAGCLRWRRSTSRAAFVVIGVLLLVFSPMLDPARVSVASQVARLESGKVKADRFDFAFLRFDGERYGRAALDRLEREATGADAALVRRQVAIVRKLKNRWNRARWRQSGPTWAPT
jgi:hypothetical protein